MTDQTLSSRRNYNLIGKYGFSFGLGSRIEKLYEPLKQVVGAPANKKIESLKCHDTSPLKLR